LSVGVRGSFRIVSGSLRIARRPTNSLPFSPTNRMPVVSFRRADLPLRST
jgi:hypothetical protein